MDFAVKAAEVFKEETDRMRREGKSRRPAREQ
jgi:hypothetical protein